MALLLISHLFLWISALAGAECGPSLQGPSPTSAFVVTAMPLRLNVGDPLALCLAIQPADAQGVWWWQPGQLGCGSRSTGPGLFRPIDATVRQETRRIAVTFTFRVVTARRLAPEATLSVTLVVLLDEESMRSVGSGESVSVQRLNALEIPNDPGVPK